MPGKPLDLCRQGLPSWTPGGKVEAVCFRWKLFHWPQDSLPMARAGPHITGGPGQGPDHLDPRGAAVLSPNT